MRSVLVLLLCCFGAGVQADQTCALRSSVTQIALVANPPLFQNVLVVQLAAEARTQKCTGSFDAFFLAFEAFITTDNAGSSATKMLITPATAAKSLSDFAPFDQVWVLDLCDGDALTEADAKDATGKWTSAGNAKTTLDALSEWFWGTANIPKRQLIVDARFTAGMSSMRSAGAFDPIHIATHADQLWKNYYTAMRLRTKANEMHGGMVIGTGMAMHFAAANAMASSIGLSTFKQPEKKLVTWPIPTAADGFAQSEWTHVITAGSAAVMTTGVHNMEFPLNAAWKGYTDQEINDMMFNSEMKIVFGATTAAGGVEKTLYLQLVSTTIVGQGNARRLWATTPSTAVPPVENAAKWRFKESDLWYGPCWNTNTKGDESWFMALAKAQTPQSPTTACLSGSTGPHVDTVNGFTSTVNSVGFFPTEGWSEHVKVYVRSKPRVYVNTEVKPNTNRVSITPEIYSPMPFMWVPQSGGHILKINTKTLAVTGTYKGSPTAEAGTSPSRTTVAADGSVWAGLRSGSFTAGGRVVKIGLSEVAGQCIDRNNDGVIQTSTGGGDDGTGAYQADVKAWAGRKYTSADGYGSSFAPGDEPEDECILLYVRVYASGVRGVAIDTKGFVWAGGAGNSKITKIHPDTGAIVGAFALSRTYGIGFSPNGIMWVSARWDAKFIAYLPSDISPQPSMGSGATTIGSSNSHSSGPSLSFKKRSYACSNCYGLTIDQGGSAWYARWSDGQVHRVDGITMALDSNSYRDEMQSPAFGSNQYSTHRYAGMCTDAHGDIWINNRASSGGGCVIVLSWKSGPRADNGGQWNIGDGKMQICGMGGPSGCGYTSDGYVWVSGTGYTASLPQGGSCPTGSYAYVSRIDPSRPEDRCKGADGKTSVLCTANNDGWNMYSKSATEWQTKLNSKVVYDVCVPQSCYTYGDLTGSNLVGSGVAAITGTFTEVYDGGAAGTTWMYASWVADIEKAGTDLVTAEARVLRTINEGNGQEVLLWTPITSGNRMNLRVGRFLQIRFTLHKAKLLDRGPYLTGIEVQFVPVVGPRDHAIDSANSIATTTSTAYAALSPSQTIFGVGPFTNAVPADLASGFTSRTAYLPNPNTAWKGASNYNYLMMYRLALWPYGNMSVTTTVLGSIDFEVEITSPACGHSISRSSGEEITFMADIRRALPPFTWTWENTDPAGVVSVLCPARPVSPHVKFLIGGAAGEDNPCVETAANFAFGKHVVKLTVTSGAGAVATATTNFIVGTGTGTDCNTAGGAAGNTPCASGATCIQKDAPPAAVGEGVCCGSSSNPISTCNEGSCPSGHYCTCPAELKGASCTICNTENGWYSAKSGVHTKADCKPCNADNNCDGLANQAHTCNSDGSCKCGSDASPKYDKLLPTRSTPTTSGQGCQACSVDHFWYPTCEKCIGHTCARPQNPSAGGSWECKNEKDDVATAADPIPIGTKCTFVVATGYTRPPEACIATLSGACSAFEGGICGKEFASVCWYPDLVSRCHCPNSLLIPTAKPTTAPVTNAPVTSKPTSAPVTSAPLAQGLTYAPTTMSPTSTPTTVPTTAPTTSVPTQAPLAGSTTHAPTSVDNNPGTPTLFGPRIGWDLTKGSTVSENGELNLVIRREPGYPTNFKIKGEVNFVVASTSNTANLQVDPSRSSVSVPPATLSDFDTKQEMFIVEDGAMEAVSKIKFKPVDDKDWEPDEFLIVYLKITEVWSKDANNNAFTVIENINTVDYGPSELYLENEFIKTGTLFKADATFKYPTRMITIVGSDESEFGFKATTTPEKECECSTLPKPSPQCNQHCINRDVNVTIITLERCPDEAKWPLECASFNVPVDVKLAWDVQASTIDSLWLDHAGQPGLESSGCLSNASNPIAPILNNEVCEKEFNNSGVISFPRFVHFPAGARTVSFEVRCDICESPQSNRVVPRSAYAEGGVPLYDGQWLLYGWRLRLFIVDPDINQPVGGLEWAESFEIIGSKALATVNVDPRNFNPAAIVDGPGKTWWQTTFPTNGPTTAPTNTPTTPPPTQGAAQEASQTDAEAIATIAVPIILSAIVALLALVVVALIVAVVAVSHLAQVRKVRKQMKSETALQLSETDFASQINATSGVAMGAHIDESHPSVAEARASAHQSNPMRNNPMRAARPAQGMAMAMEMGSNAMQPPTVDLPPADPALPPGWEAHVDESSGSTYFHNEGTGATTWGHPGNAT